MARLDDPLYCLLNSLLMVLEFSGIRAFRLLVHVYKVLKTASAPTKLLTIAIDQSKCEAIRLEHGRGYRWLAMEAVEIFLLLFDGLLQPR